jgi:hypothetical protein
MLGVREIEIAESAVQVNEFVCESCAYKSITDQDQL